MSHRGFSARSPIHGPSHVGLTTDVKLLSTPQFDACSRTLRDRFGLDVLPTLNGKELLETMRPHGIEESLAYWLEFKDDDFLAGSERKLCPLRTPDSG
jgi:hypothetical protein